MPVRFGSTRPLPQLLVRYFIFAIVSLGALLFARHTSADGAAFDLSGPRVEMTVTRSGKVLPIADVPNFQANDRLWIHPDLPESQSVHYLMIVAFLRGSTNPPPENWFTRTETWNKQVREEGVNLTVPVGAQQTLLFFAPETGGDFSTLRATVRGKPGTFVRASQDLNAASLERSRLEKYLSEVRQTSDYDPKALHERSVLLARTLGIKLNQDCFDKPAEQQASCLMQNSDQLVLDDPHSQSMVAALTSGPSTDLIGAISSTPIVAGGSFSPYVGAVVDLAKLMGSFHNAAYQYIPALALPKKNQLNLRLNNPPSFRNPKSVIVVGLPAVEAAQLPPLRAVTPDQLFCLQKSPLVLPLEGAPLVFSTDIAHDFVLHVQGKSGPAVDLPATPDAAHGGFDIDAHGASFDKLDEKLTATLRGQWGFEPFDGPTFQFRSAHPVQWQVAVADQTALIVGRDDTLHLQSDCAVCTNQVVAKTQDHKELKTTWKLAKPDELELQMPLKNESAGPIQLAIKEFGLTEPQEVALHAYAEAAHLDHFVINAGDRQGVLTGTRLDEVDSFDLNGIRFVPAKLARANDKDELRLSAQTSDPVATLAAYEKLVGKVALKDGRVLDLQTTVEPPRPKVTLLSKSIQRGAAPSAIRFATQDELPQGGQMSFFLKSDVPDKFPRTEKIEVASVDDSFHVLLTVADGTLVLQDSQTVLAVLDPLKSFGGSAFGPIQFRPVDADGSQGDWQPLATLVRVPSLKEVRCPDSPDKPCTLFGTNLFLIDSVASDAQFTHTIPVPAGYMDNTLTVPRPNGTLLYLKLRDDRATVDAAALPVLPED